MSEIKFVSKFLYTIDLNCYNSNIAVVESKEDLFDELNRKLSFPYFGFNWDALWDMYCDFHWIEQRSIYIYHQGITHMPLQELAVYLGIVVDSCEEWKKYPQHDVHFIFNSKEEKIIKDVIKRRL